MTFLGEVTSGASVKYRANFHSDQGTIEEPTTPTARLETPAGVFSDLTVPAQINSKTGHYGGTVDTTGFASGLYRIRVTGTVSTAKATATVFEFLVS